MVSQLLRQLFLAIILLCIVGKAEAQQLQFERFTTANGLPTERVFNLYMDGKGYIRACTNYGIAKYNGNEFARLCNNYPVNEGFVYCMFENAKGGIWFANSRSNIFRLSSDTAIIVKGLEETTKKISDRGLDITSLIVDEQENILFSTMAESFKLIKKEGYRSINLTELYSHGKDSTDFTIIDESNHLLVANRYPGWPTYRDVYTYKIITGNSASEKRSIEIKNKKPVRQVVRFQTDLCISAGNELIRIKGDGSVQDLTFDHTVIWITTDEEGNTWAGMEDEGLYKISPEGKIIQHYFPQATVNCILFDDQSGMWVSTARQGIYHCKNIHDYAFSDYPALTESNNMAREIDSTLFIGTSGGGLFRVEKNGRPEEIDLQGQTKELISDIIKAKDGNGYYLACKDGVLKTDAAFKKITPVLLNNKKSSAYYIAYDPKGNLFSVSRKAINKIVNDKSADFITLPSRVHAFLPLSDGTSLVGTAKGLFVFNGDSLFIPAYLRPLKALIVVGLATSCNGDIWICTAAGNGLFRLKKDHTIIAYPDVPAEVLHDVFFPNDSTIGLCMNNGIFITPVSKINDLKSWFQLYNQESEQPYLFNDELYASTNAGLLCFSLHNLKERNNSKLYFTKAVTDDSVYYRLPLTLRHDQNKIEFYFDLLDYTTNKARLFYQLEGRLTESGTEDGTRIALRNLPPGSYTLTVRSAVSLFYTNEKAITVSFVIEPAFWQTTWFFISMILLALLIIVCIVYFINLRTRNRERQKAKVTRMLAEYKLTALKAQINPHFISNSLSAIQQLIVNNKTDKAGLYLSKFSLLIRHVLKYSDKAVVKLSDELEVIDLNIQLEALRFKDDFKLERAIDPEIDADNVDVPPLIMQPFIENAIWHGLLPLKGKREPRLTIGVSMTGSDLLICIEDNGVGRSIEKKPGHESQGTQLIYNRLENINLMLGTKTAMLKIDDLFDEAGNPRGTRVSIVVPGKLNNTEYDEN